MRKTLLFAAAALLACCLSLAAAPPAARSDIRVLYVGGSADVDNTRKTYDVNSEEYRSMVAERMAAFEQMLRHYFNDVTVVHADDYNQQMSYDYDVTVMDGTPKPIAPRVRDREAGIYILAGYFSEDFSKPVITIGELGETLGSRIGNKNDWYCLCLDADAHNWRAEHPIFNGPFPVTMTVETKPTPEDAYHYPYYHDGPIPDELPMWKVQTKGYMTDQSFRVGMVARPWGYEDSPDAEYISSGVCLKTLDAVAIGRHGNFFHWGFAASPRYLTEEAKTVLANAVCYIAQFDGKGIIARKYNSRIATREYLKERKAYATVESWQERIELEEEYYKKMVEKRKELLAKQERGEKLNSLEEQELEYELTEPESMTFDDHLERDQGAAYEMFGTDVEAYHRYYDENRDYFYSEPDDFYELLVDEDAKALGIPNNDKRLLEEAIRMLESGSDVERGRRILERYTLVDFSTPAQWRRWFETNKDKLFFTESCGWYWLVDSYDPGVNDYSARNKRTAARSVETAGTDDRNPVAVAVGTTILQNGNRSLLVKIKIHPGYHIYGNVAASDPFLPTKVSVDLPDGYTAAGNLQRPAPKFYNNAGTTAYHDEVIFSQEFTGQGEGTLKVRVSYQCCDNHICFPPVEAEYTIDLK